MNHHFYGITIETWNKAKDAWFFAENYRVISECQVYDHSEFAEKAEAMCDAIAGRGANKENEMLPWLIENGFILCRNHILTANFPVFHSDVFAQICDMLKPITKIVVACMVEVSDKAENILKDHVPATVRTQCSDIAKIHHRLDVAIFFCICPNRILKCTLNVRKGRNHGRDPFFLSKYFSCKYQIQAALC